MKLFMTSNDKGARTTITGATAPGAAASPALLQRLQSHPDLASGQRHRARGAALAKERRLGGARLSSTRRPGSARLDVKVGVGKISVAYHPQARATNPTLATQGGRSLCELAFLSGAPGDRAIEALRLAFGPCGRRPGEADAHAQEVADAREKASVEPACGAGATKGFPSSAPAGITRACVAPRPRMGRPDRWVVSAQVERLSQMGVSRRKSRKSKGRSLGLCVDTRASDCLLSSTAREDEVRDSMTKAEVIERVVKRKDLPRELTKKMVSQIVDALFHGARRFLHPIAWRSQSRPVHVPALRDVLQAPEKRPGRAESAERRDHANPGTGHGGLLKAAARCRAC